MTDDTGPETPDDDDEGFSLTCQQCQCLALDRNIAVTAGAGTGKTTTLTERYREILQSNPDIGPENIVVITFTTDATSELQDSIREVVDEELTAADPDTYDRWRRAADGLDDAYIHTIHGFCSRLLREFAVEAPVHPEFDTLDETDAERLFDTALTTVLDETASLTDDDRSGPGPEGVDPASDWQFDVDDLADDVRRLARLYSRDRIADVLTALFDERPESVSWATEWATATPETYFREMAERCPPAVSPQEADDLYARTDIQEALDTIVAFADLDHEIDADDDYGQATVERIVEQLDRTGAHTDAGTAIDRAQLFTLICDEVTTGSGSGSEYSTDTYYAGKDDRWADHGLATEQTQLKDAFETLIDALDPPDRVLERDIQTARNEAPYAVALARLFRATLDEYDRRKDRQNALDYSDLIELAVTFLDDSPEACQELREQFAYIMVDEVQDTDPRQWEIVTRLSGTDADHFDGQNVFLVGDEKQSIYRFRGADVTQFRSSRTELTAANPSDVPAEQDLTNNFRTLDRPLTVINELFQRLFRPAGMEHEPVDEPVPADAFEPYEASPQWLDTARDEGTDIDGDVEYLLVPESDDDAATFGFPVGVTEADETASKAEREAHAVAARLSDLFASERLVYDQDRGEAVPVEPQHVALLFRSSTRMHAFERALETYDIPYTNLAGSGFYETPEVRPLLTLLEVLEDPTADSSLYGVLRSPLFGFTDDALVEPAAGDSSLWDALADADVDLKAARATIAEWRSRAGLDETDRVVSWSTLVSRIIDDTGYLVSIGADERPQQAVANVEKFRERLRSWEEGSALSLADVIERIQIERDADEDPGEATIPGDIEGVQLRTIHSAKGLQFPVVVVPELSRQINMRTNLPSGHIETIDGEPLLGLKAPSPDDAFSTSSTPVYDAVTDQHDREERAESKRVLYVAATRTRDLLILSGLHDADPETDSGLSEGADPEEAKRWTDWLQPLLLHDDTLLSDLATAGTATRSLGEGAVTVRRPPAGSDWRAETTRPDIPTDIEIDTPPETTSRVRLSATAFRDIIHERTTDEATGSFDLSEQPDIADDRVEASGIPQPAFGDIVHKLCELRTPEDEWPGTIRRLYDEPTAITDSDIEQVSAHARAGIRELDRIADDVDVTTRIDEYPVALRLSHGKIIGDIDHLSVTESGYHVVDYKTSDLSGQTVDELIEHYLPQVRLYACALYQSDPELDYVELTLVFTDTGVAHTNRLASSEITDLLTQYESLLREYRAEH